MKQSLEQRCAHGFLRSVVPCVECESAEQGTPIPVLRDVSLRFKSDSRVYTCGICKEIGHARTTCPKRKTTNQGTRESK